MSLTQSWNYFYINASYQEVVSAAITDIPTTYSLTELDTNYPQTIPVPHPEKRTMYYRPTQSFPQLFEENYVDGNSWYFVFIILNWHLGNLGNNFPLSTELYTPMLLWQRQAEVVRHCLIGKMLANYSLE